MISWWGGYLWSNWPILEEIDQCLSLVKQSIIFDVFFAKISQFPCLCIIGYASDLLHEDMFT